MIYLKEGSRIGSKVYFTGSDGIVYVRKAVKGSMKTQMFSCATLPAKPIKDSKFAICSTKVSFERVKSGSYRSEAERLMVEFSGSLTNFAKDMGTYTSHLYRWLNNPACIRDKDIERLSAFEIKKSDFLQAVL